MMTSLVSVTVLQNQFWVQPNRDVRCEGGTTGLINHEFNLDFAGTSRHIKQPISRVWKWEWHHAEEDKVLGGRRFIAMRKWDSIVADDVSHRTLISSRREAGLSRVRNQNAKPRRVTINPRTHLRRKEVAFTQRFATGGVPFVSFSFKNESQGHLSIMFSKFKYWL